MDILTGWLNVYREPFGKDKFFYFLGSDIHKTREAAEKIGKSNKAYHGTCYFTTTEEEPYIESEANTIDTGRACRRKRSDAGKIRGPRKAHS